MRTPAALPLLAISAAALAAPIPIDNAGFEADFAADGTFPVGPVTAWEVYNPNGLPISGNNAVGVINPTGSTFFLPGEIPEGRNAALIFLASTIDQGPVGLQQTTAAVLTPNTRYTLTVGVGNIASGTGLPPFDQFGFFDLDGFPGYAVQLVAGNPTGNPADETIIAEDDNALFGLIPEGTFRTSTISADIGPDHPALGQPLTVRLINLNETDTPQDPGIEVDFDDVRLDATPLGCNPADLADPLGTLDIDDVLLFLAAFADGDPAADLAPPAGSLDIDDVLAFLTAFAGGCP